MEDWMGRVILTEREFKAELPFDFEHLISLKKDNMILRHLQLENWESDKLWEDMGGVIWANRSFAIQNGNIYFKGGFSRWWMIRVVQRAWDNLFPAQYELKYVRVTVPGVYLRKGVDKEAWKKEVAKAVIEYGKTPHTKESLEAYKKKLES